MANSGSSVNPEPDNGHPVTKVDSLTVEGRMETSSLHKILKLIEDHPDRTLDVIRGWLH